MVPGVRVLCYRLFIKSDLTRFKLVPLYNKPLINVNVETWSQRGRHFCTLGSTDDKNTDVSVKYIQGLPHLTVPLPSRNEKCRFALKPVSHNVGDLLQMIKLEDRGIDRAAVLNTDGVRIASTCSIESLLDEPFWLHINDQKFKIVPPQRQRLSSEDLTKLGDVRKLVGQLYEVLHVSEYHIKKEKELLEELEDLKFQLSPLEEEKSKLNLLATRKSNIMTWVGLGLMSVQFGVLARLTWWEYSWDIMEPVTYFVTYGTAMGIYAYFCLTKQEYTYPMLKDRRYLRLIYKFARKNKFDIETYNKYKHKIAELEYDLRRLRDPISAKLPSSMERLGTNPTSQIDNYDISKDNYTSNPIIATNFSDKKK